MQLRTLIDALSPRRSLSVQGIQVLEFRSNGRQIGNRPTTEKRPVAAGC